MTEKELIRKLCAAIRTISDEYEHGTADSLGAAILYAKTVANQDEN